MTEPIQLESELSDEQIKTDYPVLLSTMYDQLVLIFDYAFSGQDSVLEHLAVVAVRVAVEVCSHCREQQVPCNCMRDE